MEPKRLTTNNSIKLHKTLPNGIINIDIIIACGKNVGIDLTRVQASNFALTHLTQISRGRYALKTQTVAENLIKFPDDGIQQALDLLKATGIYHVSINTNLF